MLFQLAGQIVGGFSAEQPQTSLNCMRRAAEQRRIGAGDGPFDLVQKPRRFTEKDSRHVDQELGIAVDSLKGRGHGPCSAVGRWLIGLFGFRIIASLRRFDGCRNRCRGGERSFGLRSRECRRDRRIKLSGADGLGEVIVHPRFEAAFAVSLHRLGRHGDDRQPAPRIVLANCPRGLEPVHLGHLNVHENQVERLRPGQPDRLGPIVGDDHVMPLALEQRHRELLIVEAVFGQKNA